MTVQPPPNEFIDERLAAPLAVLRERASLSMPITVAEAMQYARFAYLRGYKDGLAGVEPAEDDAA